MALFYFCGHGLERDKQYLLLEDFGETPLDPLAASIDLDRFHDGMAACAADAQVFIADDPERPYWESWAAALEALVVGLGLTTPDALDAAIPTERAPL